MIRCSMRIKFSEFQTFKLCSTNRYPHACSQLTTLSSVIISIVTVRSPSSDSLPKPKEASVVQVNRSTPCVDGTVASGVCAWHTHLWALQQRGSTLLLRAYLWRAPARFAHDSLVAMLTAGLAAPAPRNHLLHLHCPGKRVTDSFCGQCFDFQSIQQMSATRMRAESQTSSSCVRGQVACSACGAVHELISMDQCFWYYDLTATRIIIERICLAPYLGPIDRLLALYKKKNPDTHSTLLFRQCKIISKTL